MTQHDLKQPKVTLVNATQTEAHVWTSCQCDTGLFMNSSRVTADALLWYMQQRAGIHKVVQSRLDKGHAT